MANTPNYKVYVIIDNYTVCVDVSCDTPEDARKTVTELFADLGSKVGQIRVSDAASGYFIRGYS